MGHPGGRTEAQGSLGSAEQWHGGQEVAVSVLVSELGQPLHPKAAESEWAEDTSLSVHHRQPWCPSNIIATMEIREAIANVLTSRDGIL